ncbi:MAG: hypothetical protein ACP5HT_02310 [Conexivisphaera sp.]
MAVDETELKVNGRIVYVWAAMDLDTRELLALEATRSRSAMHAFLFLGGPGKVHQHAAVRRRQGPVVRVGIDVTYSHAFIKPWGDPRISSLKNRSFTAIASPKPLTLYKSLELLRY